MFLSGVCFYAVERVRIALLKYKIQLWGHVRNKSAVFNELGVFKLKKKIHDSGQLFAPQSLKCSFFLFQDFRPWWWHPSQHRRQGDGLPLQHGWGERTGPPHEQLLQQHYQQWEPVQPHAWVRISNPCSIFTDVFWLCLHWHGNIWSEV